MVCECGCVGLVFSSVFQCVCECVSVSLSVFECG